MAALFAVAGVGLGEMLALPYRPETQSAGTSDRRTDTAVERRPGGLDPKAEQNNKSTNSFAQWLESLVDFRLTDVLLVIFIGVLASKTSGLFEETAGMRTAGEKQLKATQDTAEAAVKSADALQATERAHVVETIKVSNFDSLLLLGTYYPNSPTMEDVEPRTVTVVLRFKNYGKTPATVTAYSAEIAITDTMPIFDIPTFGSQRTGEKYLIEYTLPYMGETADIDITRLFKNTFVQSTELVRQRLNIWLMGHITFVDVFQVQTTRKFIWRYDVPMRGLVPADATTIRKTGA